MTEPKDRGSRPEHEGGEEPVDRRKTIEKLLPELVKKVLEAGMSRSEDAIRGLGGMVSDMKLPKEIAGYIFEQIDETKNGALRIVAKEFRDFLEHTELADELRKALTSLSFEVKTEIRFIPNDSAVVRPDVKSTVRARRRRDTEPEGGEGGESGAGRG
jgi:hypothetical protein